MSEPLKSLLSTLMICGAVTTERAMSRDELADRCGLDAARLTPAIEVATRTGFVQVFTKNGSVYVALTPNGVLAASSAHS